MRLQRHDPCADAWETRFRGFIEALSYDYDPSQRVNRLTMELVDIFEIVSVVEMYPGQFGDPPPDASAGQIFFEDTADGDVHGMQVRIDQILGDAFDVLGHPDRVDWWNSFSGNVQIRETIYSPGESAMTAVQDAADAEFPSVGNVYGDRHGVLQAHGRYARFDPAGTAAVTTGWDFHEWRVGDGEAVVASPTDTAHIRSFATRRDLSKIINRALATPLGIADRLVEAQTVQDATSIGQFGIRPWSAQGLLTKAGVTDDVDAKGECRLFSRYYVENYATPKDRVTAIGFRSIHPDSVGAAPNWALLNQIDIGDLIHIRIDAPGGGGFHGSGLETQHLVEGVHEEVRPLTIEFDDVTLTLDVSPFAYSESNPFNPDPT